MTFTVYTGNGSHTTTSGSHTTTTTGLDGSFALSRNAAGQISRVTQSLAGLDRTTRTRTWSSSTLTGTWNDGWSNSSASPGGGGVSTTTTGGSAWGGPNGSGSYSAPPYTSTSSLANAGLEQLVDSGAPAWGANPSDGISSLVQQLIARFGSWEALPQDLKDLLSGSGSESGAGSQSAQGGTWLSWLYHTLFANRPAEEGTPPVRDLPGFGSGSGSASDSSAGETHRPDLHDEPVEYLKGLLADLFGTGSGGGSGDASGSGGGYAFMSVQDEAVTNEGGAGEEKSPRSSATHPISIAGLDATKLPDGRYQLFDNDGNYVGTYANGSGQVYRYLPGAFDDQATVQIAVSVDTIRTAIFAGRTGRQDWDDLFLTDGFITRFMSDPDREMLNPSIQDPIGTIAERMEAYSNSGIDRNRVAGATMAGPAVVAFLQYVGKRVGEQVLEGLVTRGLGKYVDFLFDARRGRILGKLKNGDEVSLSDDEAAKFREALEANNANTRVGDMLQKAKDLARDFKRFRNYDQARRGAMDWLRMHGFDASSGVATKTDKGWVEFVDKNGAGYRLEWDPDLGSTHFNVIGRGGEKGPHFIFPGGEADGKRLMRRLFPDLFPR